MQISSYLYQYICFDCIGCLCMLLYLTCGVFGVAVICSAFMLTPTPPPDQPYIPIDNTMGIVLCTLSGVAFLSCFYFWCCALFATQAREGPCTLLDCCTRSDPDPNTNYTLVSCIFWMVVIFFVAITSAITVDISGRVNIKLNYGVCSRDFNNLCVEVVLFYLMGASLFCCAFCNVICYCGICRTVGRVFGKC